MYACNNGHSEVVEILSNLPYSQDLVRAKNKEGQTGLTLAWTRGYDKVAKILVKHPGNDLKKTSRKSLFGYDI